MNVCDINTCFLVLIEKNNSTMPNIKKEIEKCKHPNSRKTIALAKQIKKLENRKKTKTGQYIKQNLIAEKAAWFRDRIPPNTEVCNAEQIKAMITEYLSRFDEELEQISIKHSVGIRKNRQHASREDIINMTKKRELEEFNTCGTEIPDLLNPKNVKILLDWTGELRFLQNIKMRRFNKKFFESDSKTNIRISNKGGTTQKEKDMEIE